MNKIYFFFAVVVISLPVFSNDAIDTVLFTVELKNIKQEYIEVEIPDVMVYPGIYGMKAVAVFKNGTTKEYKIGGIYGTGCSGEYATFFTIYTGISPIGCDWMLVNK